MKIYRVLLYSCIWGEKASDGRLGGALGFLNGPLGGTPCTYGIPPLQPIQGKNGKCRMSRLAFHLGCTLRLKMDQHGPQVKGGGMGVGLQLAEQWKVNL